eukprot:jgi/Picsp_1/5943/NSC_03300-R1_protein
MNMALSLTAKSFAAPTRVSGTASRPRRVRCTVVSPKALFGGGNKGEGGGGIPGLGNMGNFMENIKKAQNMIQIEAAKVQEELANADFEGYSSDETVRVVMSGNQEPKSVDITEEAYSQGVERLNVLVTEATKEAHARSVAGMKERMGKLAQSLGLPQPPQNM